MQPFFFPWGGYFQLINNCDYFIILDDVQLSSQSWQTRNYFYLNNKFSKISLPIKNSNKQNINQIELFNFKNWNKKFLKTLNQNYKNDNLPIDKLINLLNQDYKKLIDLNLKVIFFFKNILSIKTKIILSSELSLKKEINENPILKTSRIIQILNSFNNPEYITVPGSIPYMDKENFDYINFKTTTTLYNSFFFNHAHNFNILDLIKIFGINKIIENI